MGSLRLCNWHGIRPMAVSFVNSLHSNLNLKATRNMGPGLMTFKLEGKPINLTKSVRFSWVLPLITVACLYELHSQNSVHLAENTWSAMNLQFLSQNKWWSFLRCTCDKILHLFPSPKLSLKRCLHPLVWVSYLMAMNIFSKVTFLLVICSRTLEL